MQEGIRMGYNSPLSHDGVAQEMEIHNMRPREQFKRHPPACRSLVPFLVLVFVVSVLALLGVHPLDTARGSAAVRGFQAEVDVLLRVQTHDEGGYVDELLAHADVALTD